MTENEIPDEGATVVEATPDPGPAPEPAPEPVPFRPNARSTVTPIDAPPPPATTGLGPRNLVPGADPVTGLPAWVPEKLASATPPPEPWAGHLVPGADPVTGLPAWVPAKPPVEQVVEKWAGTLVPGADPITGLPAWVEPAVPSGAGNEAPPAGWVKVVYRGRADVARVRNPEDPKNPLRDFIFRTDQPVYVPSAVVEELLTWPREQFEVVEE